MASFAWLSRVRHTSKGAWHFCSFARQPQSCRLISLALRRMFSMLVRSRIVCWPWMVMLTGMVTGVI